VVNLKQVAHIILFACACKHTQLMSVTRVSAMAM
jgi:hypothetical protein